MVGNSQGSNLTIVGAARLYEGIVEHLRPRLSAVCPHLGRRVVKGAPKRVVIDVAVVRRVAVVAVADWALHFAEGAVDHVAVVVDCQQ